MCFPDLMTAKGLAAMVVIVPFAFFVHSILYEHGKARRPDRSETERAHRRLLWHLVAIVLMILSGQFQEVCMEVEWQAVFLTILASGIWEVIFFITAPPTSHMHRKPKEE